MASPKGHASIGIIDLGGQYCHLIARRLRDMGVSSEIHGPNAESADLSGHAGLILSGGPQSVYEKDSPKIDSSTVNLGVPMLGICYGHQLLALMLGGVVERGPGEYGVASLLVKAHEALLEDTPEKQRVWMSHSDRVTMLPSGAIELAVTETCDNAAFGDAGRRIYGVQFHPEVNHTENGPRILRNFVALCGIHAKEKFEISIDALLEKIRARAMNDSVFFLVSGGVDSTVAFVLCARALPRERVLGLYVDTGLMRKGEKEELIHNLAQIGLDDRLQTRDESRRFLTALEGVVDPEQKRHIIGRLFMDVQTDAMREIGIDPDFWLLGQGTIYPDTIESGGSFGRAAVIKTHHNRCAEVVELMKRGRVIEPLSEFYKDEVRRIGSSLGLDWKLTNRWPFPGPGLAIRCLCSDTAGVAEKLDLNDDWARLYQSVLLPVQSVGVQGDNRTYRRVVALHASNATLNYPELERISTDLCNNLSLTNRVIVQIAGVSTNLLKGAIRNPGITGKRIELLREADFIVRSSLDEEAMTDAVWQFPVVLMPLSFNGGESIILRPVNSEDGMTANFAHLPSYLIQRIAGKLMQLEMTDAVFLDVTNKPPATIEWE